MDDPCRNAASAWFNFSTSRSSEATAKRAPARLLSRPMPSRACADLVAGRAPNTLTEPFRLCAARWTRVGVLRIDRCPKVGQHARRLRGEDLDHLHEQRLIAAEARKQFVLVEGRFNVRCRRGTRRRLSDQLINERKERSRVERLDEQRVHPCGLAGFEVARHVAGRHGDDRHAPAGGLLGVPDFDGRLQAVHIRHLDIHQDEVEPAIACGSDRLLSGFDRDDVDSPGRQQSRGVVTVDAAIFGDQDATNGSFLRGIGHKCLARLAGYPQLPARFKQETRAAIRPSSPSGEWQLSTGVRPRSIDGPSGNIVD